MYSGFTIFIGCGRINMEVSMEKRSKLVPMCPNAIKNPLMLPRQEWLMRHVESAFEAMWAANYGVDTMDERKALRVALKILKRG